MFWQRYFVYGVFIPCVTSRLSQMPWQMQFTDTLKIQRDYYFDKNKLRIDEISIQLRLYFTGPPFSLVN